jgi:hypothetical protein
LKTVVGDVVLNLRQVPEQRLRVRLPATHSMCIAESIHRQIFSGLVSFGVYHLPPGGIAAWRVYMIICGLVTFVLSILFWFFLPDNPMTAYFLTQEEKIIAIERLRDQSTGIENKHWKREQFIEALKDWKPWAFAIFAAIDNLPNSLTNQSALIISQSRNCYTSRQEGSR